MDRYVIPFPRRVCPRSAAAEAGPSWSAGLLFDGVEESPAGLLTAPARLFADPAVLMMLGVPLALVAAALADSHAGRRQRPGDVAAPRTKMSPHGQPARDHSRPRCQEHHGEQIGLQPRPQQ